LNNPFRYTDPSGDISEKTWNFLEAVDRNNPMHYLFFEGGYNLVNGIESGNTKQALKGGGKLTLNTGVIILGGLAVGVGGGLVAESVGLVGGASACAAGGAKGVGEATTSAVVIASIAILVSDYFITALFF
jgi:hypothetical protein